MPEHPAQAMLIEAASYAFAVHLLRAYDTFGVRETAHHHGLSPKGIALVTSYINDNLESPIRLSKLATLAQVSKFHFGRMFKVNMGVSPMTYLERVRIEHAKCLLQSKPSSLYDVALSCGFADQSYFAKRFARHVCCTPSEYRRRHSSCTPVVQDFRRTDMRSTKVSMSHQAHYLTNTARSSA
jgi:AraC family transcriptional regulator